MPAQLLYNPDYHDDWAWSLALKGATDQELAEAFGVSKRTILRWKNEHPLLQKRTRGGRMWLMPKSRRPYTSGPSVTK